MFERVISYTNLDDEPVEATFWFGLDTAEIALLKETHKRDIGEYFNRIIRSEDNLEIMTMFQELLRLGVGRREGQRFDKSEDVKNDFIQTGAFSALFWELMQTPDQGATFVNNMFPKKLIEQYEAEQARTYTDDELLDMTNAEFVRVAGHKKNRDKRMTVIAMRRKELNKAKHNQKTAA